MEESVPCCFFYTLLLFTQVAERSDGPEVCIRSVVVIVTRDFRPSVHFLLEIFIKFSSLDQCITFLAKILARGIGIFIELIQNVQHWFRPMLRAGRFCHPIRADADQEAGQYDHTRLDFYIF